jgi:hypothetical protein
MMGADCVFKECEGISPCIHTRLGVSLRGSALVIEVTRKSLDPEANGAHHQGPVRYEDQVPGTGIFDMPKREGVMMRFKTPQRYIGQFG